MQVLLNDFFQFSDLPADRLVGVYDIRLVALSYLVAVFASYIALDLAGRLRDPNNTETSKALWLSGGAIAMGAGIWSMHFIGMLSFTIPGVALQYDIYWTGISLLVAIFASAFALYLLQSSLLNIMHLAGGGIILGLGIAAMHYTGMEAMLTSLNFKYLPVIFLLSILVAILASEAAIWLALKSNTIIQRLRNRMKLVSALIMGVAICGMHYTGMAASIFTPLCSPIIDASRESLNPTILAMSIAAITFVILSVAFFASTYKEARNQQQFEQARQLGMAEIAASVLHSVGNILNSVNVSAHTLSEQISSSKLSDLEKLSTLLSEHKADLSTYLTTDPRGIKIVEYLTVLADYQKTEKQKISQEIESILKNTALIRDIISTQQALNKTTGFTNVIALDELLDESLLIVGIQNNKNIIVKKHYEKIPAIAVDKVKLVQVLVNLLRNAKDSLLEAKTDHKTLTLEISSVKQEKIIVKVIDNGLGISPKNLTKIFVHGFTTKESGHGFGLHASALAMNEIGGKIHVSSEGLNQGATFTLEIPYRLPKS